MSKRVHVSCIVPTRNRPAFVDRATKYFLAQTYKNSELIIVDDGGEPVKAAPSDSRVRYIRSERELSIGAKLNLGISESRGEVLSKIDDDDYYHPDFIRTALIHLEHARSKGSLLAWAQFLVYLAGEDCVRDCNLGWPAGATLCFARDVWQRCHFRDLSSGEDSAFVQDHADELFTLCAPELYMLVRHGRNTWTTMRDNKTAVDLFLMSLPPYRKTLQDVVGVDNCVYYRNLPALCL